MFPATSLTALVSAFASSGHPRCIGEGCYVPLPDSCTAASRRHSICSSARASTDGGTSRPSALAVLRLITSSYLVGACTGKSAGFLPYLRQLHSVQPLACSSSILPSCIWLWTA